MGQNCIALAFFTPFLTFLFLFSTFFFIFVFFYYFTNMNTIGNLKLCENTVYYYLFYQKDNRNHTDIDSLRLQLESKIVEYCAHLAPYLTKYIWHKEPFNLRAVQQESSLYLFVVFFLCFVKLYFELNRSTSLWFHVL